MQEIQLHIDGGCQGNGKAINHGAYAYIVVLGSQILQKYSYGIRNTTNNQMEVSSLLSGLKWLIDNGYNAYTLTVNSDSQYVLNYLRTINQLHARGYKDAKGQQIPNFKYWFKAYKLLEQFKEVKTVKVKGHSGHYLNEMADSMCTESINKIKNWDRKYGK